MGGWGGGSGVEVLGVMLDVVVHEGVDEEVAVVVTLQAPNNNKIREQQTLNTLILY